VHLVGFITEEICYGARSHERKITQSYSCKGNIALKMAGIPAEMCWWQ